MHGFDKAFYVMMEGSTLDGKFKLNAKGQTTFSRLLLFGSIEPSDSREYLLFELIYHNQ